MKISVCIASYNGEKFIRQQLSSILSQLSETDEIIISDNISKDSTIDIIKSFADPRIKLHLFKTQNIVLNFENACKNATGDAIILSDQDDVWLGGKVDRIISELQAYDVIVTDCKVVDEQLNLLHESLFKLTNPGTGIVKNLVKNSYTGCCMAFNRKVLDVALPFPRDLPMHDWWIGLIGEVVGKVAFINEPFLLYRRHGLNVSTLTTLSALSILKKINMRFRLIKNLALRFIFEI